MRNEICLVYGSAAKRLMLDEELLTLLNKARENNTEKEITGLLLYRDATFIQVLEGERNRVEDLFDVIKRDPRHYGVTTILKRSIEKREFSEWWMGFIHLDKHDYSSLEGYTDFLTNIKSLDYMMKHPTRLYNMMLMLRSQLNY